jgi:ABC-2 type transport system ATP-binding protein
MRTDDSDATVIALARLDAIRALEVAPASLDDAFLALTSPDRHGDAETGRDRHGVGKTGPDLHRAVEDGHHRDVAGDHQRDLEEV